MTDSNETEPAAVSEQARRKALPEAAQRALDEADTRRSEAEAVAEADLPRDENGGPRNIEPTRYGDWERKGITYDF